MDLRVKNKLGAFVAALLVGVMMCCGCVTNRATESGTLPGFMVTNFSEQTLSYEVVPEVKVCINAPLPMRKGCDTKLIFFTLPNGNSTAQSIGKKIKPGEDWHFDIQHIGAQTRFLRNVLTNDNLVVIYVEAAQKSWPAWRKKHADETTVIAGLVDSVRKRFEAYPNRVTISGHSGGGSFIFGFINSHETIPDWLERIAFLDSNYAYDAKMRHDQKLLRWLASSKEHRLSILAYNDAIALLNGKTFVSANGGTWGRSHAMLKDFSKELKFETKTTGNLTTAKALDGQVEFLLMENPEQKIYHTVQVERNGFIQSLLSGTKFEGIGYTYFGERAYVQFISE